MSDLANLADISASKHKKRSAISLVIFLSFCLALLIIFINLAIWQMYRLHWKEDLIQRVNQRLAQPMKNAPMPQSWANIDERNYAYLPVKIQGKFLNDKQIFVTAMHEDSTGFWWLMPLEITNNKLVFINRGFLTQDQFLHKSYLADEQNKPTFITGLLRLSEKNNGLMHKNDPQHHLWYNRTIKQMSESLGLNPENVAPYFIDAFSIKGQNEAILGLTRVYLPNNHLSYAITWSVLALFVLGAMIYLLYDYFKYQPRR